LSRETDVKENVLVCGAGFSVAPSSNASCIIFLVVTETVYVEFRCGYVGVMIGMK
jgi:hypothetical protein